MSEISLSSVRNFFVDQRTQEFTVKGAATLITAMAVGMIGMAIGAAHSSSTTGCFVLGSGTLLFSAGAIAMLALTNSKKKVRLEPLEEKDPNQELRETGFNAFNLDNMKKA